MKVLRAAKERLSNGDPVLTLTVPADDVDGIERALVVDGDDRIVGLLLPAADAEAFLFRRFVAKLNVEE